ncbi:short-chain dehydrogenase [Halioglobus sp. HI00S01]|uniref:SDR family NAD(P)-dependent oxidoreductase n=1 Tax=Halioglobus sp. HI00S01 TaxID=1822214 RepID=UPI0007C3A5C5|nr:SDR family NAD(P)-dependent oxidoreductase [Halioglobus sp. HI00S01]KZX58583.1 short-chain dehydrogenase [Halioglobus sp. HI00S01]
MSQFDHTSTTNDVIAGINLHGKRVVVTGASSGLGVETARVMAAAGAAVTLVARDQGKLATALAGLQEAVPGATFDAAIADLADLDSVRTGAAAILAHAPQIDILVNNAGVMACPLLRTAQGFEMQFGTNHVGHFLLTSLLMPALLQGAPARVVNLSSAAHKFAPVNLEDPNYQQRDYQKWQSYGESKTANVLFSVGLEQRFGARGVHALAVHPGMIATELGRHMDQVDFEMIAGDTDPADMPYKSIPAGAATSVWAATSPELAGRGGLYLEDCHIAEPAAGDSRCGVESYALDAQAADQLWSLTEELIGEAFATG